MSGPNVVVIMPSDDDAATKKKPRKSLYPPGKNRWGMPIDKAPREYEKLRPLVICGPSGVGKGTLIDKLMEDFPERFGFSVSHTTRKPRPGEVDGVHYNFVEKAAMEKDIAEGKFLEHARVHDNIYGTSFAAVDAVSNAGRVCVLDIDVQGAELVKKSDLDAVYVFIAPPSMAELERRLRGRGTEKEEAIKTRLANAGKEMEKTKEDGFFNRVIVNDTIHTSYCSLKAVIAGEIYGRPWEWDGDAAPSAAYKKRFYEDRVLFWLSDFFSVMKDVVNIACDVGPVLLAGAVGAAAAFRYMDKN